MMAEMQAEMKAISTKSSDSRFDTYEKKVVRTEVTENSNPNNGVAFLRENPEDPALNQYWYSQNSVDALTQEVSRLITKYGKDFKVAFLSTPSIYFALEEEQRSQCYVFDYDKKWDEDRGFVFYDFNDPTNVTSNHEQQDTGKTLDLKGAFHLMVIDPPFITREVWEKYTESAKFLLNSPPGPSSDGTGMIIGTTVAENAPFMNELLSCDAQVFMPSIPNLVYQYNCYANFDDAEFLGKKNPEIIED